MSPFIHDAHHSGSRPLTLMDASPSAISANDHPARSGPRQGVPVGRPVRHHRSRTVFLPASRVAVYSLDLLGGQRGHVIGERTGHDLGMEALKQLRGALAASRLAL